MKLYCKSTSGNIDTFDYISSEKINLLLRCLYYNIYVDIKEGNYSKVTIRSKGKKFKINMKKLKKFI